MYDIKGSRCLVLGGSGFIGQNLCEALLKYGAEVTNFGRSPCKYINNTNLTNVVGRFDDRVALASALERQDIVFHLISGSVPGSSNRDPAAEMHANPLATVYLLDICQASRVKKIDFASSGGAIYGIPKQTPISEDSPTNPISAYGISKLTIEKYLELYRYMHGLEYVSLRIANPYGRFQMGEKSQGLIGTFVHRALLGLPLEIWGNGEVVRDYIYISDVINAFIRAVSYNGPHRVINVGSGCGISVKNILLEVENSIDNGPLETVYKPGRSSDVPINILDISRAKAEIDWSPQVNFAEGLVETVAWMKKTSGFYREGSSYSF